MQISGHVAVLLIHALSCERISEQISLDIGSSSFLLSRGPRSDIGKLLARAQPLQPTKASLARDFPEDCPNGELRLSGVYKVRKEVVLHGPCEVTGDGGELQVQAPIHFNGNVSFRGSLVVKYVKKNNPQHSNNKMKMIFRRALNRALGGTEGPCISVNGSLTLQAGADVSIQDCQNQQQPTALGGCLFVGREAELLSGARLQLKNCSAGGVGAGLGGGLYVGTTFRQRGAVVFAEGCFASEGGGALYACGGLDMSGGSLSAVDSSATEEGGCILAYGLTNISAGHMNLTNCRSRAPRGGGSGGGLWANSLEVAAAARLTIHDCHAAFGGGMYAQRHAGIHAQGLHISNSSASSFGGCLYMKSGNVSFSGPLALQSCAAKGAGGGIYSVRGAFEAEEISCNGCDAPVAAVLQLEKQGKVSADLRAVRFWSHSRSSSAIAAGAGSTVKIGKMDCMEAPGCILQAQQANVSQLLCSRGEGRESFAEQDGLQCKPCAEGRTRLEQNRADAHCVLCPNITDTDIRCTPTELGLPGGYMVTWNHSKPSDLSNWFRCPSEIACPGGHLGASDRPGGTAQEIWAMCAQGYVGEACTQCDDGYARGDSNVLQCVPCSTDLHQAAWYVSFYLLKNLALFTSAVGSVSGAKRRRAESATLLNQLMSFAVVAGIAMSGAMQTRTFQEDLQASSQAVFRYLSLPAEMVSQGQGSGGASMSCECLLAMMGMKQTVYHTHILTSIWPAVLVSWLAVTKGGWLAAVVGVNVFLPVFVAGFGKYLVSFRLRPEALPGGELLMDFLPPGPHMTSCILERICAVLAAIAIALVLSVGSWIYAVRYRREPLEPHVAYLVQAYKPECAAWEAERLVRKVFLALITTMLPVTLSPALQLEAVTLVLIASLAANMYFMPYQVGSWNGREAGLLMVALTMTGLTTCLIANDLHWAKSTFTQRALVFVICAMASGTCAIMIGALAAAFLNERRNTPKADEAE